MAVTSDWKSYWRDTSNAPIERLVQWYKEKYGYRQFCDFIERVHILEVGSGKGIVSKLLKETGHDVTTSDISGAHSPDLVFDCRRIPFPDNSFDSVISTGLLEHFNNGDLVEIIREQLRVAKTCVFNVPEKSGWWNILWGFRRFCGAKLDLHFNLKSKKQMSEFLTMFKFKHDIYRILFFKFPYLVVVCRR